MVTWASLSTVTNLLVNLDMEWRNTPTFKVQTLILLWATSFLHTRETKTLFKTREAHLKWVLDTCPHADIRAHTPLWCSTDIGFRSALKRLNIACQTIWKLITLEQENLIFNISLLHILCLVTVFKFRIIQTLLPWKFNLWNAPIHYELNDTKRRPWFRDENSSGISRCY